LFVHGGTSVFRVSVFAPADQQAPIVGLSIQLTWVIDPDNVIVIIIVIIGPLSVANAILDEKLPRLPCKDPVPRGPG